MLSYTLNNQGANTKPLYFSAAKVMKYLVFTNALLQYILIQQGKSTSETFYLELI